MSENNVAEPLILYMERDVFMAPVTFWTCQLKLSRVEHLLTDEFGHIVYMIPMIPKFHCELNPIERVWAQAKRYAKAHCKYNIQSLRNVIIPSLDVVTLDNIHNHFRKIRHYMFAYLEGKTCERLQKRN